MDYEREIIELKRAFVQFEQAVDYLRNIIFSLMEQHGMIDKKYPIHPAEQGVLKTPSFVGTNNTKSIVNKELDRVLEPAKLAEPALYWWCPNCNVIVNPKAVTYDECHGSKQGGCGGKVKAKELKECQLPAKTYLNVVLGESESTGTLEIGGKLPPIGQPAEQNKVEKKYCQNCGHYQPVPNNCKSPKVCYDFACWIPTEQDKLDIKCENCKSKNRNWGFCIACRSDNFSTFEPKEDKCENCANEKCLQHRPFNSGTCEAYEPKEVCKTCGGSGEVYCKESPVPAHKPCPDPCHSWNKPKPDNHKVTEMLNRAVDTANKVFADKKIYKCLCGMKLKVCIAPYTEVWGVRCPNKADGFHLLYRGTFPTEAALLEELEKLEGKK